MGHYHFIQVFPHLIARKKQPCFRMVDNIMHLIGLEFM